jgi:glycine cleavage system aminomethyltransferase T/glycine/D-amino acid oxidase-like deaminating enzyme
MVDASGATSSPNTARVVIVGAGIVGNAVAAHLSRRGWTDLVLIDKGTLPNPGGSTGHASNFLFPVDHGKELTLLTLESQRQFEAMGVSTTCGGIEVARTPARMEEFNRRMASATAWGVESKLLTPSEIADMVPFIDESVILGGFYTPSTSVVDSVRAGSLFRDEAVQSGALRILSDTEVIDIVVEDGRVRAIETTAGQMEADYVVIACGVWSPRIAKMAGASIPLTPAVHQMIDVGPIEILAATGSEIGYPIIRDMDTFMYERQSSGSMEVGSYAHRPIFHDPDEIPSVAEASLSPTELPFTADDFDPQLMDAIELMPGILEDAEIRYAINGLLSLTPDAMPLLGETVEVEGLWSAAAVWIKEAPAVGRMIAEWMTDGYPETDPHQSDIARFYTFEHDEAHVLERAAEHFNKTYGIVHPREQWESRRDIFRSPLHSVTQGLGAEFFQAGGWERPQWYETNAGLVDKYHVPHRSNEWDARWWSPIINAEHLAMRETVGMVDLAAFPIFEVSGPGVTDYVESLAVNQCGRAVGSATYTPLLTPTGGFRSDLTILRLDEHRYWVVSGAFEGARDAHWLQANLPDSGSVEFRDLTQEFVTIGVWGPHAHALISTLTDDDVSIDSFPYATTREVFLGSIPVRMLRISYVGEPGWELYVPAERAGDLWGHLWRAGAPLGVVPVGAGVYGTTGRMEKGYRLMGADLTSEYTPVEAGLARRSVKAADFVGKDAYLRARASDPIATLCTFIVEDCRSPSDGAKRYMMGGEAILSTNGDRIVDRRGRPSYVTSAGSAPTLGSFLLMGYLPTDLARNGARFLVRYMNEDFPIVVASAGATPLFDPENRHLRT